MIAAARNLEHPEDEKSPLRFVTGIVVSDKAYEAGLAQLLGTGPERQHTADCYDILTANGHTRVWRQGALPP